MGGFKGGLGFDDAAGGVFESTCITVIVEFGFLGHASLVT